MAFFFFYSKLPRRTFGRTAPLFISDIAVTPTANHPCADMLRTLHFFLFLFFVCYRRIAVYVFVLVHSLRFVTNLFVTTVNRCCCLRLEPVTNPNATVADM